MEIEGIIMRGCQKCAKQLTSQLTEYEYYFQVGAHVFKTLSVLFEIIVSLLIKKLFYRCSVWTFLIITHTWRLSVFNIVLLARIFTSKDFSALK